MSGTRGMGQAVEPGATHPAPPASQPTTPPSGTPNIPPAPPSARQMRNLSPRDPRGQTARQPTPPPGQRPSTSRPSGRRQPRRQRAPRSDSGLYLPLWSIALMLLVVAGVAGGVVLLVIGLGNSGRDTVNALGTPIPPTQPPPVLIVSSPVPTERPASFPASPATPTLPPQFDPAANTGLLRAPEDFRLAGPTLPTPVITPTPITIGPGVTVEVIDVGEQQLNVRNQAGVFGTEIRFRAGEGERFRVVDGPLQVDNLTWWQIQDFNDPNRTGWAASQYLLAVPEGI